MSDANILYTDDGTIRVDDGVARSGGEIIQLQDGRAAVVEALNAVTAGDEYNARVRGVIEATCSSLTVTDLDATPEAWWDETNSKVVAVQPTTGFKLGTFTAIVASTHTKCKINLNAGITEVTIDTTVGASPGTSLAIKTGLAGIIGIPVVQITRLASSKYRTIITSFDLVMSGGTVTIHNVASNYTLTEADTITVKARGFA